MNEIATADHVMLAGAPTIQGLRFRHCRGQADYPAIVQLHEACRERDEVDPLSAWESIPTLDSLLRGPSAHRAADPAADMLVAELNGQMIGCNTVGWWTETDGASVYLHEGWVRPEWRRRGIGTAMLEWMERRIAELARAHGAQGRAVYAANASSTQPELTALLLGHGYLKAGGMLEMEAAGPYNVPDARLPHGFAQHPVLPEHAPLIYDSYLDAYADYTEVRGETEKDGQRFIARILRDPTLWHVAWDGDHIVGQVGCGIDRGRGIIHEASVRKPWRRRGIGKALMASALRSLRDRGVTRVRLITRAQNPYGAIDLYRSAGFHPLKEFAWFRKPV